MKKIIVLLLALMMMLAACTNTPTPAAPETSSDTALADEPEITEEQTMAPETTNTLEPEPTLAPEATEAPTDEAVTENSVQAYQTMDLLIERDGLSIYGQVYLPGEGDGPYTTVIIGHGFGGTHRDNADHAAYLAENGIAAYVFDFAGGSNSSRSDGDTRDMSVLTEVEDMKAVLAHFKTLDFVDSEQIYLMGESQGGFVAALTASQMADNVAGLILVYPAFVIPDHGRQAYDTIADVPEKVNLWGVTLGAGYYTDIWDLDVYQEISGYTGDVLIFHGTADTLVPIAYSERAVETYQSAELVVYEGAGHGFDATRTRQTSERILAFIDNGESTPSTATLIPDLIPMPGEYSQAIEDGGTVERVDYTTTYQGATYDKHAYVYLPAGYDPNGDTAYNVFYLMHGGSGSAETFFGGEGQTSSLKSVLDHMISNNELEPLIVVTPSYYNPGSRDDAALTRDFHEELLNDLIPAVEGTYHTYAQSVDPDGLENSRDHRGFGGFSMGSVTTWYTFVYNLDTFRYFLPMSGDSWIAGRLGGSSQPDATAAYLGDVVNQSSYGVDGFFIYAITGTDDMAYSNETSQIEAMQTYEDTFIYCNDMDRCNLYYNVEPGGEHSYAYMNAYIYNALPYFFTE